MWVILVCLTNEALIAAGSDPSKIEVTRQNLTQILSDVWKEF